MSGVAWAATLHCNASNSKNVTQAVGSTSGQIWLPHTPCLLMEGHATQVGGLRGRRRLHGRRGLHGCHHWRGGPLKEGGGR
eukprot:3821633-Alexandrium_andersonii.AAC.1